MSVNILDSRSDMSSQLTHLLSRAARLRSRLDAGRSSGKYTELQLLRVRNLLLRIERRIIGVLTQKGRRSRVMRPAYVTVPLGRGHR